MVFTQIQKQIILKNNDRNKYCRGATASFAMYHFRVSNRNSNKKEIN